MSNPFNNLNTSGLEQAGDVLGGQFGPVESGVYNATCKMVYASKSKHGAHAMNLEFDLDVNGKPHTYRETIYITNRNGEPFYMKDNKKNPLPGFTTANDIALLMTGKSIEAQDFEERVVKIYDRDQGKELPTAVPVAVDLLGKSITLAILKSIVDKNVQDASGNYVPSGETREENSIDKAFHADSGRTVSEVTRGLEKGEFIEQWRDKNTGAVRNKAKGAVGTAGSPGRPGTAAATPAAGGAKNLFG